MKFTRVSVMLAVVASMATAMLGSTPASASDPEFVMIDSLGGHFNAGQVATCGIDTDGVAWCWGDNFFHQLGNGTTDDSENPVQVSANPASGFTNTAVTDISVGNMSACAIEGGSVYCWGYNSAGQLGDGTTDISSIPVKVADNGSFTNSGISQVSVGSMSACALNSSGVAFCWGTNSYGRLGAGVDPSTTAQSALPVMVADGGGFTNGAISKIELGYLSACLLRDLGAGNQTVYCWGSRSDGQVGGAPTYSSADFYTLPTVVPTGGDLVNTDVTDFSVGEAHACVVEDGSVICWGGYTGGTNPASAPAWPPVTIATGGGFNNTNVTAISAGALVTCATEVGAVYCWGSDANRGGGDPAPGGTGAVKVVSTTEFPNVAVTDVQMSPFGACGLEGGVVSCWGYLPGYADTDDLAMTAQPVTFLATPVAGDIDLDDVDTTGGTLVITGSGFTGTTSVTFGSTTATFTVDNDGQITITVPALDAGDVVLTIVTPGGTITETITISVPATTTSSTTTTVSPTTTAAPTTVAPITTVAEGSSALVDSSNQEVLTATGGTGVLLIDGEPVEVRIVQADEDLRRSVPGARTAEQVTALRAVAADMLAEIRTIVGENAVIPVTVVDVATGAVIYGLVTDPVTNEQLAVPVEDVAFIAGGGIALMVGGADGTNNPANIAFDGVLEFGEGGYVAVLAYGLTPGAAGEVVVMSTPQLLDTFTVGTDGGVAAQAAIPADLAPGEHTVVVAVDGQSASLGFRVLSAGTLPVTGGSSSLPSALAVLLAAVGAFGVLVVSRRRHTT